MIKKTNLIGSACLGAIALVSALPSTSQAQLTGAPAYLRSAWETEYKTIPLLSAGDLVPLTGGAADGYQMVGIADGMGGYRSKKDFIFYVQHEFNTGVASNPIIGEDFLRGAFVSKFVIDCKTGTVKSGNLAHVRSYQDGVLVGDTARFDNGDGTTELGGKDFGRFCSGALAGPKQGFDRWIWFANEESDTAFGATGMFNPLGSQTVVMFEDPESGEDIANAIAPLGHFPKEQSVPLSKKINGGAYKDKTIIISLEDGPADGDYSGVYLYVGDKNKSIKKPTSITEVLEKNGLLTGSLYYLARATPGDDLPDFNTEGTKIECQWVEIAGIDDGAAGTKDASTMSQDELRELMNGTNPYTMAASGLPDALNFSRPEDGDWNPKNPLDLWFMATGGDNSSGTSNALCRIYSLILDKKDPTANCNLNLVYDGVSTPFADGPISGDNCAFNRKGEFMVQEDATGNGGAEMNIRCRNASVWKIDTNKGYDKKNCVLTKAPARVAEVTAIGRDKVVAWETDDDDAPIAADDDGSLTIIPSGRGKWESSGIVDGSACLNGSWFLNVQAHGPTTTDINFDGAVDFTGDSALNTLNPNTTAVSRPAPNDFEKLLVEDTQILLLLPCKSKGLPKAESYYTTINDLP